MYEGKDPSDARLPHFFGTR